MTLETLNAGLDTVWVVLTAAMILLMEGGFALLEAGFVRTKNNVNIIMKVFADITIGTLCYFVVGFGLMYGTDVFGTIGASGFLLKGDLSHIDLTISMDAFWLFQGAFVIAVISIVSGAVAERINFRAYLIFVVMMTAFIYPIAGHWVWGGGWLSGLGMQDFAGSAVIHALGGFSALAAAIVIGPRAGKFTSRGLVPFRCRVIFHWHLSGHSFYGLAGLGLMQEVPCRLQMYALAILPLSRCSQLHQGGR